MGTGLTFDEYIELKAMPLAGADPVFIQAVEEEREQMFPMPLVVAANHLWSRGYDCRPESLELLIENGVVSQADPDAWSRANIADGGESSRTCKRQETRPPERMVREQTAQARPRLGQTAPQPLRRLHGERRASDECRPRKSTRLDSARSCRLHQELGCRCRTQDKRGL